MLCIYANILQERIRCKKQNDFVQKHFVLYRDFIHSEMNFCVPLSPLKEMLLGVIGFNFSKTYLITC